MLMTRREPATVSGSLLEEFMEPLGLTRVHCPKQWVCNGSTLMSYAKTRVNSPPPRR